MKKLLALLFISFWVVGCEDKPGFFIDGTENLTSLSALIDLKKDDPQSSFPLYYYGKAPDSLLGLSFKDIPITSDQYVFDKISGQLCNIQFFIPKESNRMLIIERLNQDKRFKYIDTGDTFMFTRLMQWTADNDKTYVVLTSVVNSNKSHLAITFEKEGCH